MKQFCHLLKRLQMYKEFGYSQWRILISLAWRYFYLVITLQKTLIKTSAPKPQSGCLFEVWQCKKPTPSSCQFDWKATWPMPGISPPKCTCNQFSHGNLLGVENVWSTSSWGNGIFIDDYKRAFGEWSFRFVLDDICYCNLRARTCSEKSVKTVLALKSQRSWALVVERFDV